MKKKFVLLVSLLLAAQLTVLVSGTALAQTITATILGTVRDATGAVVTGVTITINNPKIGLARTVLSDSSGNFISPQLPVGEYEVTAQLAGFKKAIASGIVLEVDQKARVDIVMEVGEIAQTVEVTGQAPLIKTDSSDVGMVVNNKRVTDLPLNGRVYYHLNLLDSGTAQRTGWRTSIWGPVGGANFSFNGSPSDGNQYLIDGIMSQEVTVTHPTMKVTIDAIQEFKQQASQYTAEFGNGAGAQVNLVTKSGTNNFHGSAWEFIRNDAFDARNFFDSSRELRKAQGLSPLPEFKENQFGATFGGPVVKDKTFFFLSYEGTRIRKAITRTFSVPPVARRNGDFTGTSPIYDPNTTRPDPNNPGRFIRDPFAGNIIPANRIDPVAKKVLDSLFLLPDRAGETANLVASPTQRVNEDQFTMRIDHKFNAANSVFGRFSLTEPRRILPLTFSQLPNFADNWDQPAKNAVISYTRIFSPTTLNEFKVGFNRFIQKLTDVDNARDVPKELGINRLDSTFGGNPTISIAGFNRTAGITNSPNNRYDNVYQLVDNFSFVRGKHSMGTGVSFRHVQNNRAGTQPNPRGVFTFTARYTTLPGVAATGNALADFLLGFPTQTQGGSGNGFRDDRHNELGLYYKDDWQVHPNLTLNLGLRYEYNQPWHEIHDRLTFFDFRLGDVVSTQEFVKQGYPASSYFADKKAFAPRFGLAYRPFGNIKTVIRGGYGIFHSFTQGYPLVVHNNPSQQTKSYTFNADPTFPTLTLANGFPLSLATESFTAWAWQTYWKNPYNQQWSLYVQRELTSNFTLEVGYLGNKGTNLMGPRDINRAAPGSTSLVSRRPYPKYSSVTVMQTYGDSSYHALKVNLERRFGEGLSFRASYSLAKGLNNTGLGSFGESTETAKRNVFDNASEKGRSLYDARNRFTLSYTYALPFGKGKRWLSDTRGFAGALVNGWQINGITILQHGTPIDVVLSSDVSNTGGGGADNRPNRVRDPDKDAPHTVEQFFNTAAFALPAQFTWGNAGKNITTGPGISGWDISLFKNFPVRESQALQFRVEVFNFVNHPNFDPPNAQFGNPQFGRIFSAGDSRQIQFALKYTF